MGVVGSLASMYGDISALPLVFSCERLTRCDSSKVTLRLARRRGTTFDELLRSFIEEDF